MELLLGATQDPEGRSQHDHTPPPGRTGSFPLHAVRPGEQAGVCGAPVRQMVDGTWPPAVEATCHDCERALEEGGPKVQPRDDPEFRRVTPFGQP
jgi:hypothetical protein